MKINTDESLWKLKFEVNRWILTIAEFKRIRLKIEKKFYKLQMYKLEQTSNESSNF